MTVQMRCPIPGNGVRMKKRKLEYSMVKTTKKK
jgi:hypothetical protein